MKLEDICDALKKLGVVEVILLTDDDVPYIEFNGFDGEHFKIKATNAEFAEYGI